MNSPMTVFSRSRSRSLRGTTLVEVLVVIVILLVGILAILNIFPKGFQVLTQSRKNAQATALARAEVERLKLFSAELPDMILPVTESGFTADVAPQTLSPLGASLNSAGVLLTGGGSPIGDWAYFTGPNRVRRVVGETQVISAPRRVSATVTGSLVMANFGPVDTTPAQPFIVTGPLLSPAPFPADFTLVAGSVYSTAFTYAGNQAIVGDFNGQPGVAVRVQPTDSQYLVTAYALVLSNGNLQKRYFRNVPVNVVGNASVPAGQTYWVLAPLANLLQSAISDGGVVQNVQLDSVQVRRGLRNVGSFSGDPYEYLVLSPGLGTILINPAAASETVNTGEGRKPMSVTLDYTVADWRILTEDVRLGQADRGEFQLPLGALKTASGNGPDGRPSAGIPGLEVGDTQSPLADHFLVVDEDTGGIVCERDPSDVNTTWIQVDKSRGQVRILDSSTSAPDLQITVRLADDSYQTFDLAGRALRVLYMTRDEFSTQVFKPASTYSQSGQAPIIGEYYLGGSNPAVGGLTTRIYFPVADTNQVISIGQLNYIGGGERRSVVGRDFVVRVRAGDPVGLPSIDIAEVDPAATGFDPDAAPAVRGVKGASISVRALWNPDFFSLGTNAIQNFQRLERWGTGWRRSTVQTFIERGEVAQ